ncbi:MAG: 6-pyruvoyl tetrahydrobiopterin synthase [Chloroflexi bacterium]|nr:6-pyruvoyl tetrahydrobiopterin synthase [Chloroflexota bacterium]
MTLPPPEDPGGYVQRHVSVQGVRLRFAAAHMATLGDDLEPLHGHNYELRCRVDGSLTADRWVIDFSALKRIAREACDELDHRFLLQARSPLLDIAHDEGRWRLRFGDRGYVFPDADVVALPIENSTAELLAQWLWERVAEGLAGGGHDTIARLAVEVEEMPGQAGGYARDLAPGPPRPV